VLSIDEVERVMAQPDITTDLGLRDRAMLETFYSTGIRRGELLALAVHDVDEERRTVLVREGKGKKDRFVPIGERALAWVAAYLRDIRPLLSLRDDEGALFLSSDGVSLTPTTISTLVRHILERADIAKPGACHLFRHAMATLMLEGGADLTSIQLILGHSSPQTTEIYAKMSIHKLKAIHAATHPGAHLKRHGDRPEGHDADELVEAIAGELHECDASEPDPAA